MFTITALNTAHHRYRGLVEDMTNSASRPDYAFMNNATPEALEQAFRAIPGVHGMGIGADGFVVKLLPDHEDSRALIPDHLEGVPVSIVVGGEIAAEPTTVVCLAPGPERRSSTSSRENRSIYA